MTATMNQCRSCGNKCYPGTLCSSCLFAEPSRAEPGETVYVEGGHRFLAPQEIYQAPKEALMRMEQVHKMRAEADALEAELIRDYEARIQSAVQFLKQIGVHYQVSKVNAV